MSLPGAPTRLIAFSTKVVNLGGEGEVDGALMCRARGSWSPGGEAAAPARQLTNYRKRAFSLSSPPTPACLSPINPLILWSQTMFQ
jgi:hypothetical protein